MSTVGFERALGRIAMVGADMGGDTAFRAILDLLERHQQWDAHEIVQAYGRESIEVAFRTAAWAAEDSQPAGDAAAINNTRHGPEGKKAGGAT